MGGDSGNPRPSAAPPSRASKLRDGGLLMFISLWLIFSGRGWPSRTAFTCDRHALPAAQCQLVSHNLLLGATTQTIPLAQIQNAWQRTIGVQDYYQEYVYLQTDTGEIKLGDIYQLDQIRAFLADPTLPQLELVAANSPFDFVLGPGMGGLLFIFGLRQFITNLLAR